MSNRYFTQFFYTPHNKPTLLDAKFTVAPADAGGLGVIPGNVGPGVKAVYMHTSATANALNPNPANGVIIVTLKGNYNLYLGGFQQITGAPGTAAATVTAHTAYVIASLGTATLAQWQAVGLPLGIMPVVGASFVATASATIGGSATAAPTATAGSGIDHIELLGDPSQTITVKSAYGAGGVGGTGGGYLVYQCFSAGAVAAPAVGSVIRLGIYLNNTASGV